MSIVPFNVGVLAANSAVRGLGGSSSSNNWSELQSLQRLIDQTGKLGAGKTTASVNSSQVAQVTSDNSSGSVSFQGNVVQAAKSATLTVVGGNGGTLTSSGQYQLTGNAGTVKLNLTQGQSLNNVAAVLNQQTQATGVSASVQGNNLVLTSTTAGSNSTVAFKRLDPSTTTVSGQNSAQVTSFQIASQSSNAPTTVTGSVSSSASAANLVYHGAAGGTVAGTASFQLTGSLGSTAVSLTAGEKLSDVANRINQATGSTGVIASVNGNDLNLVSSTTGVNSTVQITSINAAQQVTTSPTNSSQVSGVSVNSITANTTENLSGQVTQAATQAAVTLQGSNQGTIVDSATFQLSGSLGSANFSVTQGQALSDVAASINAQTSSTGVAANVVSNSIVFQSTGVGSAASVAVHLTDITHTTVVSGVNSSQVSSFQTDSLTTGASDTINGTVTQTATQAQVTLQGTSQGTIADTATFQLSGALGSSNISVTQGQSLSAVATQVNALTTTTGVTASVVSNNLVFQSTGVGSAANVGVQLNNITHTNVTTGVNSAQLSSFQINSLQTDASETLTGTVTQTAAQANLTLQGSSQGTIIDTATFQLSGALGSSNISVTQGQSLSSVATQVNSLTASTGVVASVVSNNLVFQSSGVGSAANVGVQLTNITHTNVISGVNSSQLSSFQINSLQTGASETLSGTVTQAATQAALTLQGSSQGTIIDTATFQLSGTLGSSSISVTQGQSLSSVATQVNALTTSTGVVASVVSNNLVFNSTNVGSASNVGVQLTNITHTNVVSGVNASQISSFQINSLTTDASETLAGSITQTAGAAQLSYSGALGFVGANSTFTLRGSQGSVQISTTTFEGLSTLVSQVNASTATTGVKAVLSGSTVNFLSSGVGSSATVAVNVTSGSFGVSGGNGNGTANGTNAIAVINGQTVTGNANSFQYTDSLGSYSFATTAGYTGSISSINVKSQAGQFNVTGGNGSGRATGADAVATINGRTVTGTGNAFQYTDAVGSYSFNTVAGYTGALSAISVKSQAGQFNVTGGNGSGRANGIDAVATINGRTVTGTGNAFQFTDSIGSYSFNTVAGYTGALSAISVKSQAGQFNLSGGHGNGTANGADAVATINGQTVTGTGNSFHYTDSVGSYTFKTASGYTGTLSTIHVNSQAGQFNLTGGRGDGTANGTDVVATINGQTVTGNGNSVQYSDGSGQYGINFAAGYQGTFSPISVQSQAMTFDVQGGDASGAAHGTNLVATLNGVAFSSTTNQITVGGSNGSYKIKFASGFTGQINPITVSPNTALKIIGGDQNNVAHGSDATAMINGTLQTAAGSTFTVSVNGTNVKLDINPSFEGAFDRILVDQMTTVGGTTSTASMPSAIPVSASSDHSLDPASLKLIQDQINQSLVLEQLRSLSNQNQSDGSSKSSATQRSTSDNQPDTTAIKPASKRNSSSNNGYSSSNWTASAGQSSGKKVSVLS